MCLSINGAEVTRDPQAKKRLNSRADKMAQRADTLPTDC